MSCATRKPSRLVASMNVPVSASRGANATACTRMSKASQCVFRCAKPRAMSSSSATSMAKVMPDSNCLASGTTRSAMRSMCEKARTAPSRCMACAMPQAMERSVARPTIRARLAFRNPMIAPSFFLASTLIVVGGVDVHDQPLSGSDLMVLVQPVPALELGDRDLKLTRNAEHRVAAAHGIQHAPAAHHSLVAIAPRARLDDQPLTLHQRIAGIQVVQPRQRAHRHAVAACDTRESLAGADAIDDLPLPAAAIALRPVDARRR